MSTEREEPALSCFLRKVRGSSHAFLAKATDGVQYVFKFADPVKRPNLPFNEAIGSELYNLAQLTTPAWRPLRITESFVNQNPGCWLETSDGRVPPPLGVGFGSCYLGEGSLRLYELLPGNAYVRVRNRDDFWLAWLLDAAANHADNRQAVFCQGMDAKFTAVFIDHGHMFGGPEGRCDAHLMKSAYLDGRIYPPLLSKQVKRIKKDVLNIAWDRVWRKAHKLPEGWKTESGLARLSVCLEVLSSSKVIDDILYSLNFLQTQTYRPVAHDAPPAGKSMHSVLRPGLRPAARRDCAIA